MVLDSSDEEENSNTDDGLPQSISTSSIETNGGILSPNSYNKLVDQRNEAIGHAKDLRNAAYQASHRAEGLDAKVQRQRERSEDLLQKGGKGKGRR